MGGKGKKNITINTAIANNTIPNKTFNLHLFVIWKMMMVMIIMMRKNTKRVFEGKVKK